MALSTRTFGVEFEVFFEHVKLVDMVYDFPKVFETELQIAGEWFTEDGKPNTRETAYGYAKAYGFSEVFNLDYYNAVDKLLKAQKFNGWKLHEDLSIEGPNPIEVVTPILQGTTGIQQVVRFCNIFQKYASVNESTGLHVHVGASDFLNRGSAARRLTLALLHFKNFEPLFDSLVASHRKDNRFAMSLDSHDEILTNYKRIIQDDATKLNAMLNILTKNERYKKLNLESLAKHKTIEFRQMQGTLNPNIVKNWIVICLSFVDMIISTEASFVGLLKNLTAIKEEPGQQDANQAMLAKMKQILSGPEMRSYLIRRLEVGVPIIAQMPAIANMLTLDTSKYFDPNMGQYYYVFSIPKDAFKAAAGFGEDVSGQKEHILLDKIAWSIRNIMLLQFPTMSTSVDGNKINFFIPNASANEQLKNKQVTPQEAIPVLTAQKNLATKSGIPKGMPSRAFNTIKQSS